MKYFQRAMCYPFCDLCIFSIQRLVRQDKNAHLSLCFYTLSSYLFWLYFLDVVYHNFTLKDKFWYWAKCASIKYLVNHAILAAVVALKTLFFWKITYYFMWYSQTTYMCIIMSFICKTVQNRDASCQRCPKSVLTG